MKKLDTESFIEKAIQIHGGAYDYYDTNYIKSKAKVVIVCPTHGKFLQSPNAHLNGQGCSRCKKCYRPSNEEFVARAKELHKNKYTYHYSHYVNSNTKVIITCKRHGNFTQTPSMHLEGNGCPKCARNYKRNNYSFIQKAKEKHGNLYGYSKVRYINSNRKITVVCPKHGNFSQTPAMHLCGNGCPSCKISKGEVKIYKWLADHKIIFRQQMTFCDCVNPSTHRRLRFDFYLPTKNTLIEYDGEQHFESGHLVGGLHIINNQEYEEIICKDKIKTEYARSRHIRLLRIPYKSYDKIEAILDKMKLCLK